LDSFLHHPELCELKYYCYSIIILQQQQKQHNIQTAGVLGEVSRFRSIVELTVKTPPIANAIAVYIISLILEVAVASLRSAVINLHIFHQIDRLGSVLSHYITLINTLTILIKVRLGTARSTFKAEEARFFDFSIAAVFNCLLFRFITVLFLLVEFSQ
jgi:hypothetical protein